MDKMIADDIKKVMGEGEKKAPVKSIKLKVKFQDKKEELAKKHKSVGKEIHRRVVGNEIKK